MILTVTLNPSLDISYSLSSLIVDDVNRCDKVSKTAGGKGLNVTRVLKQLGVPVLATGLIGGHIGNYIMSQLKETNIDFNFSNISDETRNSIAVLHDNGLQTEVLESGPMISEEEEQGFLIKFKKLVNQATLVVLSGSLPQGLNSDFYYKLIKIAYPKPVLLDTSGESLRLALNEEEKPYLIKPNLSELESLVKLNGLSEDEEKLKEVLKFNLFEGIEWIVISMGKSGAFVKHRNHFYRVTIPVVEAINPVGSGDSTIAGLAASMFKKLDDIDMLKNAMVAGILNAQEEQTGYINMEKFDELFKKIKVLEI